MHIIYVDDKAKRHTLRFSRLTQYLALSSVVLLVFGLFFMGFYCGLHNNLDHNKQKDWVNSWRVELKEQKKALDDARSENQMNLDAFAAQVAKLQAHIARLDALGSHLTKIANIDNSLFNFAVDLSDDDLHDNNSVGNEVASEGTLDFFKSFDDLSGNIANLDNQLTLLQSILKYQKLDQQTLVRGKPILVGHVSSYYGYRNHPITKVRLLHKGVDFVGKEGTPILAVASGVVAFAGEKGGYGLMVEINHGDGYATRYAHNSSLIVQVGDLVNKGDKIAEMGSTGHSTGTHVHFEVWNNGKAENPITYLTKK